MYIHKHIIYITHIYNYKYIYIYTHNCIHTYVYERRERLRKDRYNKISVLQKGNTSIKDNIIQQNKF